MTQLTRRTVIEAAAVAPLLAAAVAQAADPPNKGASVNTDAFGFDAGSLHGISEKLIPVRMGNRSLARL